MVRTPVKASGKDVNRITRIQAPINSRQDGCCSRKVWAEEGSRPQSCIHDRLRRPDRRHESEHLTVLVDHPVPRNDNINMAQLEVEDKPSWAEK
jgi:hypothetical protein